MKSIKNPKNIKICISGDKKKCSLKEQIHHDKILSNHNLMKKINKAKVLILLEQNCNIQKYHIKKVQIQTSANFLLDNNFLSPGLSDRYIYNNLKKNLIISKNHSKPNKTERNIHCSGWKKYYGSPELSTRNYSIMKNNFTSYMNVNDSNLNQSTSIQGIFKIHNSKNQNSKMDISQNLKKINAKKKNLKEISNYNGNFNKKKAMINANRKISYGLTTRNSRKKPLIYKKDINKKINNISNNNINQISFLELSNIINKTNTITNNNNTLSKYNNNNDLKYILQKKIFLKNKKKLTKNKQEKENNNNIKNIFEKKKMVI